MSRSETEKITEESNDGASPTHRPKRRKTCHDGSPCVVSQPDRQPIDARYHSYDIVWICALPLEMAAARVMLDAVHDPLPALAGDTNIYVLGSIQDHNVVMTCLADYGTNNAASAITDMKRTFPSIRAGFIVGIGGGVPSKSDVRLGDVVVGSRVMQYDLGKVTRDGYMERTAVPKMPQPLLNKAVSTLRSTHELEPSMIPSILEERMQNYPDYHRPNLPDHLFQATYYHEVSEPDCEKCNREKLVPRRSRASNNPAIHYGAIASGNQVMRNGIERDKIAREFDIVCFEMEAAGLMDVLPCLPIRGICDYSDSHKNKKWQKYAAATAAACTREILFTLTGTAKRPENDSFSSYVVGNQDEMSSLDKDKLQENRERIMKLICFQQMDSRQQSIDLAHAETCQWFLDHPAHKNWVDPVKLEEHHGFLWIAGKPGAGKSTLMKFLFERARARDVERRALTASFFFNARGESLEKSVSGAYRSLIIQLLEWFPDLQTVLDGPDFEGLKMCPSLNHLTRILSNAILALNGRSLTCFIDALDECDEQQVVDMIQYFEDLSEQTANCGVAFQICFSSRHYPYIVLRNGIRITLEDQQGHSQDLAAYVTSHLRVNLDALDELRCKILAKASGVFLWVVLVVKILNKEYRRGRLAMTKQLERLPNSLSELFKDILTRDNESMEDLLLSILWILYAEWPLKPQEYYQALWSGLSVQNLVDAEIPDIMNDDDAEIGRYVIGSSKGLAEITKSEPHTVQFIHESVRDFLLSDNGIHELWPDLGFEWQISSHETLKKCCNRYFHAFCLQGIPSSVTTTTDLGFSLEPKTYFPFLEYVCDNIFFHAETAADLVCQKAFLHNFPLEEWIRAFRSLHSKPKGLYSPATPLLCILADRGYPNLIRTIVKETPLTDAIGDKYQYPLIRALKHNHQGTVSALLDLSPENEATVNSIMAEYDISVQNKTSEGHTMLSWAAKHNQCSLMSILLQKGFPVNRKDPQGQTPLLRAIKAKNLSATKVLLENGADPNITCSTDQTPLSLALILHQKEIAKSLLIMDAKVNTPIVARVEPLMIASWEGDEALAGLLLEKGADPNERFSSDQTPLSHSICYDQLRLAELFLKHGADPNGLDEQGRSPLTHAVTANHDSAAELLLKRGADPNKPDRNGQTPLQLARQYKDQTLIRILSNPRIGGGAWEVDKRGGMVTCTAHTIDQN